MELAFHQETVPVGIEFPEDLHHCLRTFDTTETGESAASEKGDHGLPPHSYALPISAVNPNPTLECAKLPEEEGGLPEAVPLPFPLLWALESWKELHGTRSDRSVARA